jgi:endonuclease/exonuclease/phosphatase family metal-dependent hydrolase
VLILPQKSSLPTVLIRVARWLSLLALLVGLSPACATTTKAPSSIRVLVYNIHAGKDAADQTNLERVSALIKSTAADVVLLQEVDRGTKRSGNVDQIAVLGQQTGYSTAFGRSLDYDGGLYGIAALALGGIASPVTESLPIEPPQARAGGSYEPRAALMLVASTALGPVNALNTHLDASRDEHYRLQESKHILLLIKRMSANRWPVMAGGDFNAEPGSGTYRQLVDGGVRDAWTECGAGDGFTYPAEKPIKRIDYLFLTSPLSCSHAEVIDSQASDHRPLLVTVTRH